MPWNEPGRDKDPWGGGKEPADLDEIVRNIQRRLRSLLGGGGPVGTGAGGTGGMIGWLVPLVLLVWVASGTYMVDSAERGIVMRFGQYAATTMPGLHWHMPWPIESKEIVNVDHIRSFNHHALMLTEDENIVQIDIAVQYRVSDAKQYLFNIRDPELTLGEVSESAIREAVGKNKMDFILSVGRDKIQSDTKALIQETLDNYKSGIQVTSVNLQKAQAPDQVREAFDDVNKAREDAQRLRYQAESYANDILPKARGAAVRQIQDAEAYKARVVAEAQGDASRFDQVLAAYKQAPAITRKRLYLDAMADVLGNTSKIVVSAKGTSNLMYLPLDKLLKQSSQSGAESAKGNGSSGSSSSQNSSGSDRSRDDARDRGGRP